MMVIQHAAKVFVFPIPGFASGQVAADRDCVFPDGAWLPGRRSLVVNRLADHGFRNEVDVLRLLIIGRIAELVQAGRLKLHRKRIALFLREVDHHVLDLRILPQ